MFRAIFERVSLCLNVLCGRRTAMYRNILNGNPTAFRVAIEGRLKAGDNAMVIECLVETHCHDRGDGIHVGANSTVFRCVSQGWPGYGVSSSDDRGNTFISNIAGTVR